MPRVRAPESGGEWIVEAIDGTQYVVEPGAEIELPVADAWSAVHGSGFALVEGETLPERSPLENHWRLSDLG
jgi:hypothetical protein